MVFSHYAMMLWAILWAFNNTYHIATTISKTEAEMDADDDAILRGEEPSDPSESENAVTELPEGFTDWVERNQERIEQAKSLPYFLRDNEVMITGEEVEDRKATSLQTNEDVPKTGIVPDERGRFVEITHEEMMENLRKLSREGTHEEAYVILEDGRVYHKRGEAGSVHFDKIDEWPIFKGATIYHNHYNETLSPNDVVLMYFHRLAAIHAITENGDYAAYLPKKVKNITTGELIKIYEQAAYRVANRLFQVNSIEADKIRANMVEEQMKEFCKMLNIRYEFKQA